jgi:hypothetical protein
MAVKTADKETKSDQQRISYLSFDSAFISFLYSALRSAPE